MAEFMAELKRDLWLALRGAADGPVVGGAIALANSVSALHPAPKTPTNARKESSRTECLCGKEED